MGPTRWFLSRRAEQQKGRTTKRKTVVPSAITDSGYRMMIGSLPEGGGDPFGEVSCLGQALAGTAPFVRRHMILAYHASTDASQCGAKRQPALQPPSRGSPSRTRRQ
jgi:hypothetical protein